MREAAAELDFELAARLRDEVFELKAAGDPTRARILKLLEADPHASQRRIADELGISLGRVNFCLQALVEKGLVKVNNFRNSDNKRAYLYLLTPRGIEDKAVVTARFFRRKLDEYEALKRELEELRREAGQSAQRLQHTDGK